MSHKKGKVISRTPVQKRSSTGYVIAALALVALIGGAIALMRTSAVTAKATSTLANTSAVAKQAAVVVPTTLAKPTAAAPTTDAAPSPKDGSALIAMTAQDGVIRLAAADFSDSQARFYTFKAGTKTILFFVLQSSDGVIRAAFDACDVCYPSKKGYHQEGDEVVCNNCGSRFPSVKINEVKGGCNPAPLERETQGGNIVIKVADLEAGAKYF